MTTAHAYTLLLEAAALATSFAMLWLSFWLRDRHREYPAADLARAQQDGAIVGRLALASVASGLRLTINLASSNVQPASEKDKAVLYRPEDAQHFDDEPQIQAEQH
jgi:RsiW-degrading membrane proteinase PrsW (M82 family)